MPELFDVHVLGVDPNKSELLEDIKTKVSSLLKIDENKLQQILFPESGRVCIEQSVPEHNAQKVCQVLREVGLLCTYEPTPKSSWGELSLAPIESDQPKLELLNCPNCGIKLEFEDGVEPEFCYGCNFHVRAYQEKSREREEYEEVRKQMLQKMAARRQFEKQEMLAHQEKMKREHLEEQVLNDLGTNFKKRWKTVFKSGNNNKVVLPVALAVSIAGVSIAAYLYFVSNAQNSLATGDSIQQALNEPTNKLNLQTNDPSLDGMADLENKTPSQIVMGDAHKRISELLQQNGVKLNVPGEKHADGKSQDAGQGSDQAAVDSNQTGGLGKSIYDSILRDFDNDNEWSSYLAQRVNNYIAQKNYKAAYSISQIEPQLKERVRHLGLIANELYTLKRGDLADPIISNLRLQIQAQSVENQVVLKSQLGSVLKGNPIQLELFNEIEKSSEQIQNPVDASNALALAADFQKRVGQGAVASKNLLLAQQKLNEMKPSFEQMKGFVNLAKNYKLMADHLNAEASMLFAELALIKADEKLKEEGYSILYSAAYGYGINDTLPTKYYTALSNPIMRSYSIYKGIQTRIEQNLNLNTTSDQLNNITLPEYAALTNALVSSIETKPEMKNALLDTAKLKVGAIEDIQSKAIVASRVARLLARQGKTEDALLMFNNALESVNKIENIAQRDIALVLLANDQAKVFNIKESMQALALIQDALLKKNASDLVQSIDAVKSYLENSVGAKTMASN